MMSQPALSPKVYSLQKGNKMLSVLHRRTEYLVGFSKVMNARKVHYSIHMHPQLILLRDTNIDLHQDLFDKGYDLHLTLDVKSTLFIPKNKQKCIDPIYDAVFTMVQMEERDFLQLPIKSDKGIVVPYELLDETEDEYMFRSYVIDPLITSSV